MQKLNKFAQKLIFIYAKICSKNCFQKIAKIILKNCIKMFDFILAFD